MSQHDLDIANQTFPNTRSDLNLALKALGSTSSGTSVPSTNYANQLWYDTSANILYIRNEDNDANITIMALDQANDTVEYFKSDSIRTPLIEFTDGTDAITIASNGNVSCAGTCTAVTFSGAGTSLTGVTLKTSTTGSSNIAVGTTAQRDGSPASGMFRFNSTLTQFEGYNGSEWGSIGGAGGTSWQAVKTGDYTASAGEGIFANTSASAWTLTLPSSPSIGEEVSFKDYASSFHTYNLTIGRNGKPIEGVAENLVISVKGAGNTLVFTDDTKGWLIKNK
jgi:hypothetical protein